jgi:hypothetical protein
MSRSLRRFFFGVGNQYSRGKRAATASSNIAFPVPRNVAGDFTMPYLGAPFVPEGDFQGLLDAIDVVVQIHPKRFPHGHEPLTRTFASSSMLAELKAELT